MTKAERAALPPTWWQCDPALFSWACRELQGEMRNSTFGQLAALANYGPLAHQHRLTKRQRERLSRVQEE